jgi:hypothetical protein
MEYLKAGFSEEQRRGEAEAETDVLESWLSGMSEGAAGEKDDAGDGEPPRDERKSRGGG